MNERDVIVRHQDVTLNDPIVIAAFRGWNDAGEAATSAAQHLAHVWGAERIASIDPEEFFDFQVVRPKVELVDGITRRIQWPTNEFFAASNTGARHDAVLLVGTEPSLKWRTFANAVVELATSNKASLVITLGALLADVPHSRAVPITGTAIDQELVERLGLQRSRYEGPTGIVGVVHDACANAGLPSASLWAAVPHYVSVSPNPKAALALVEKTSALIGAQIDVSDLIGATEAYQSRVEELVAADDDIQAYVHLLEERTDDTAPTIEAGDLPSGEDLAAELEKYLRDQD